MGCRYCKKMRNAGDKTPVLLLTARGSVEDRVAGLDLGADDYLVKTICILTSWWRVYGCCCAAAMDRCRTCCSAVVWKLDLNSRRVSRDGRELQLSAKEFAVLEYLLRNQGVVLARETIENHVWDYDLRAVPM